jgi:hypothetical protein
MRHLGDKAVRQILVGLQIIGVVGFREAFTAVRDSNTDDREALLDIALAVLREHNYIPDSNLPLYRRAIWREILRTRGDDFSEFLTEVEVVVAGEAGVDRDRFVKTLVSVFAEHELHPVITFAPKEAEGPHPKLLIDGETIVKGLTTRRAFKRAVGKRISHW